MLRLKLARVSLKTFPVKCSGQLRPGLHQTLVAKPSGSFVGRLPVLLSCLCGCSFSRCLDLYLCPRSLKMAMNVDPASLLPELPSPDDLRPFPTQRRVDYLPMTCYRQMQPAALPLLTLGRRGSRVPRTGANAPAEGTEEIPAPPAPPTDAVGPSSSVKGLSAVCIDHTGQWVAVGGDDCLLRICELTTGKVFLCFKLQQRVTAAAFHPRLPILAVAIEDQLVFLVVDLPLFDKKACEQAIHSKRKKTDGREAEPTANESTGNEDDKQAGDERRTGLLEAKELLTLTEVSPEEEEEEEDGTVEQKRRQQTLKGVGVWREVATQARAPVDAGAVHGSKSRPRCISIERNGGASQAGAHLGRDNDEGRDSIPTEDDFIVSAPLGGVLCGLSILHDSTIRSISWHHKGTTERDRTIPPPPWLSGASDRLVGAFRIRFWPSLLVHQKLAPIFYNILSEWDASGARVVLR